MTGAEVVIEGLRACGLHIDGYTAGDLVDISDAVLAALETAGYSVVPIANVTDMEGLLLRDLLAFVRQQAAAVSGDEK